MVTVPLLTPRTMPVVPLMVATEGLLLIQLPPVTVELSVEVELIHNEVVPLIVPAGVVGVTVTSSVATPMPQAELTR
jgi:hypothetical protein